MFVCPNINQPEWKELVSQIGEEKAYMAFFRNGNVVPSVSRARDLVTERGLMEDLEKINAISKDEIEQMLVNSNVVYAQPNIIDGQNYYTIRRDGKERDGFSRITERYGLVLRYQDDLVTVHEDAINMFNQFANSDDIKDLSLVDLSRLFLRRIGVTTIEGADDILQRYGSNAVADIANRMVMVQSGMSDVALPEEAMHFFIEMLPQDHPALLEALDQIRLKRVYKDTLQQYADNPDYQLKGEPNFAKIRKEALAKELVSQLQKKEKSGVFQRLLDMIMNWIRSSKVKNDPFDVLERMFVSQEIGNLNMNVNSTEIYHQLNDEQKKFYEGQQMNEAQKETLGKVFGLTSNVIFDDTDGKHDYIHSYLLHNLVSVTTVLGSDFWSELDKPEIMKDILENLSIEYPNVYEPTDKDQVKKLVDRALTDLIEGRLTEDDLAILVKEKTLKAIVKATESRRKTLFGTALHEIVQSIIEGKTVDVVKLSRDVEYFMDSATLQKMIYGTPYEKGIFTIIQDLLRDGHVLIPEIEIANTRLAGKLDIIAIDKNGVAHIYDFKTKFINNKWDKKKKTFEEEYNTVINLPSRYGIKDEDNTIAELRGQRRSLKQKYTQQQVLYKHLLMEAGIRTGNIHFIGIPYSLDEDSKKVDDFRIIVSEPLKYDEALGYYFFEDTDPNMDAINGPKVLRENPRLKELDHLSKEKLKEAFGTMMARLSQIRDSFIRRKDSAIREVVTAEDANVDEVSEQINRVEKTLDVYDQFSEFIQIQKNFIDMIDSSGPIISKVAGEFDRLRRTSSLTAEARTQKLNELMKMKSFLVGYEKMFEELLKYFDDSIVTIEDGKSNMLVDRIKQMNAEIQNVKNLYVETVMPDVAATLGDSFSKELVDDMRREYNEMIASAKARGLNKRVEELTKMRDNLPNQNILKEYLKGNKGDVGYFFSYLTATISNPDIIVAGLAKRLKAALDRVRLINKDLRDSLSKQLEQRHKEYGRGLDLKSQNESLVYDTLSIDPKTGQTYTIRVLKSEFDEERMHYDYTVLKMKYDEERLKPDNKEAIKSARKAVRDFEKRHFTSKYTPEYNRLTSMLDTDVTYQGQRTTVRKIRDDIMEKIRNVQSRYPMEDIQKGNIASEDLEELRNHWDSYYELGRMFDEKGSPKTGDNLKIAEVMQAYGEVSKKIMEDIELTSAFERAREEQKALFGEDSQEYAEWLRINTRIVVAQDYYDEMERISQELSEILPNERNEEVADLYKELRLVSTPYKDQDGNIQGHLMNDEITERVKNIQNQIRILTADDTLYDNGGLTYEERLEYNKLNALRKSGSISFDPYRWNELNKLKQERLNRKSVEMETQIEAHIAENLSVEELKKLVERYKELLKERKAMSRWENTKYYDQEMRRQKEAFAESRGVSLFEMEGNVALIDEFRETEWFKNNHNFRIHSIFDDEGEPVDTVTYEPIQKWKRNMPAAKYLERRPARHFYKRRVKEFYEDENGNRVQLINKDNRDIKGRRQGKTNEEYRREYGTDHPYLNKEYVALRQRVNDNSATAKEKIDYENLIYLKKTMLEAQENIEHSQRLGLAVPFMEKSYIERTIETKGKNVSDSTKSIWEGFSRLWKRNENDIDEGLPTPTESSRLATVDNEQVRFIPVRYTSRGDIDSASYDVWGGVLNYVASINRKKELEKELAFVNALEEVLGDTDNQPKSETSNLVFNRVFKKYGLPDLDKKINLGSNRRMDVIKSFINSTLYNEEYFAGIDIMGVNTQKAVSNLMKLSSWSILGLAPLNWTVNLISGNVQNMVESAGGNMFGFGDYTRAKGVLYGNGAFNGKYGSVVKDMMEDFSRVGNLSYWGQIMEIFDPIQGDFENEYGKKTSWNAAKNIFNLGIYAGKVWGEWEIQMSAFIAFMKAHRLYNGKLYSKESFITMKLGSDLTSMTMYEIQEKKRLAILEFEKLDVSLLDMFSMQNGKVDVKPEYANVFQLDSQQFSDITARLHSMQKKINGSYASFDKAYAEKTSIGRMMFFFRKYVIPLAVNRLGVMRENYESMTVEQGFYLTFVQTMAADLRNYRFNVIKNWHTYSDFEKRAIKRTMTDFGMILMVHLAYTLLLGWDNDDPDRFKKLKQKGWGAQAAVYMLLKVKSETDQFIPLPFFGLSEIKRIYSNPSLIFNEITRYLNLTGLLFLHIGEMIGLTEGEMLYYKSKVDESGVKDKGDAKIMAELAKIIGYTGRVFNPMDAIKSFEYSQKLK